MRPRPRDPAEALAIARLRAIRESLLALHQALLNHERERYERAYGRIDSAQRALQLVLHDPWFSWLRPLAALVVQIDERTADDTVLTDADVNRYAQEGRELLRGQNEAFGHEYRRSLQEQPAVVVAHAQVTSMLARAD